MVEPPTSDVALPAEPIPVFPLPNLVLFPGQNLPLHIFEPRYRQLVRDALEGSGFIVVANVVGGVSDVQPALAPTATAGKIVRHQRLADGRFNIVVHGLARVTFDEVDSERLYRRLRCTPIAEPSGQNAELPDAKRVALLALVGMVMQLAREKIPELALPVEPDDAAFSFRIADLLVADGARRQRVLEAATMTARVDALTEALAELCAAVSRDRAGVASGRGTGTSRPS